MGYAKEKFGNLARILNRDRGTLEERLNEALLEVHQCQRSDFSNYAQHAELRRLLEEATAEPAETGRIPKTIAKWSEAQRESMRDRLLDLARRVAAS